MKATPGTRIGGKRGAAGTAASARLGKKPPERLAPAAGSNRQAGALIQAAESPRALRVASTGVGQPEIVIIACIAAQRMLGGARNERSPNKMVARAIASALRSVADDPFCTVPKALTVLADAFDDLAYVPPHAGAWYTIKELVQAQPNGVGLSKRSIDRLVSRIRKTMPAGTTWRVRPRPPERRRGGGEIEVHASALPPKVQAALGSTGPTGKGATR